MPNIIAVTGSPRGGTSLTMQIFAHAMGEDRIIYTKPDSKGAKRKLPPEVDALMKWANKRDGIDETKERKKDMNPRGFYEGWPCMGIPWSLVNHQRMKRVEEMPERKIAKIVGEGLSKTNPEYIESVVVILRPPRFVAKSQEKLAGQINIRDKNEGMHNVRRESNIHTPDFWISHMTSVAEWLNAFPLIPVHVIEYENLLSQEGKAAELQSLQDFIGEGDFIGAGGEAIDTTLRRSSPREENAPEVEADFRFAESLYPLLKAKNWPGVLFAYRKWRRTKYNEAKGRKPDQYLCYRVNLPVHRRTCEECLKRGTVMQNLKRRAESTDVNWIKEPCVYECANREDGEDYKTPEESIAANFWSADPTEAPPL